MNSFLITLKFWSCLHTKLTNFQNIFLLEDSVLKQTPNLLCLQLSITQYKYIADYIFKMPASIRREDNGGKIKFAINEVVWAKITGYPWWPATITSLPSRNKSSFRVDFFFETSHAFVSESKMEKYAHLRDDSLITKSQNKSLRKAIALADKAVQELGVDQYSSEEANDAVEPPSERQIQLFEQQKGEPLELQENFISEQSKRQQAQQKQKHIGLQNEFENTFEHINQCYQPIPEVIEEEEQESLQSQCSSDEIKNHELREKNKLIQKILNQYNLNNIPKLDKKRKDKQLKATLINSRDRHQRDVTKLSKVIHKSGKKTRKNHFRNNIKPRQEIQIQTLLTRKVFKALWVKKALSFEQRKRISQDLSCQILKQVPVNPILLHRLLNWIQISPVENIKNFYTNWESFQNEKEKASSMTTEEQ